MRAFLDTQITQTIESLLQAGNNNVQTLLMQELVYISDEIVYKETLNLPTTW